MSTIEEIRVLTLWQPWASFIAHLFKEYETRSWSTSYRGKIAIHAAKRPIDQDGIDTIAKVSAITGGKSPKLWGKPQQPLVDNYPCGVIVAIADLTNCLKMSSWGTPQQGLIDIDFEVTELEYAVGNWQEGRYAWRLENVLALPKPIPFKGGQGLRPLTDGAALHQVQQQLLQLSQTA